MNDYDFDRLIDKINRLSPAGLQAFLLAAEFDQKIRRHLWVASGALVLLAAYLGPGWESVAILAVAMSLLSVWRFRKIHQWLFEAICRTAYRLQ